MLNNFIIINASGSVFETVAYGIGIILVGVLAILNAPEWDLFQRKFITSVSLALFCNYIFVVYYYDEFGFGVAEVVLLETSWNKESSYFFIVAFDAQATILWLFFSSLSVWWLFWEWWVREHNSTGWNPIFDTKGFAILFMFFQILLTFVCIGTCTYYVP